MAKCPSCKINLPAGTLTTTIGLSAKPILAGQCPECKAELKWIRSWSTNLRSAALGLIVFIFPIYAMSDIKTIDFILRTPKIWSVILGFIIGIIVIFLFTGRVLVASTTEPSDD
jgi:hypothetical protein